MITRIVKMTFVPEKVPAFLEIFKANHAKIRASKGCHHLELFHESGKPNVIFTLSHWDSEEELHAYRASALFEATWAKTKVLFAAEPEAWTLRQAQGDIV